MTEPCDLSATNARRLIGRKRLSPVELVESCIARAEAVDHAVNALASRDFDRARSTARDAEAAVMRGDELGALHGLPVGVKDLEDTAGLRTTYGSVIYRDHVPTTDGGTVPSVRAAGAVVLAKTNTPEFGAGANTRNSVHGATGNPFDPARSAAGSSGGSAAALACGMVPLATGSDLGGSLRNPAAFCGIVGFRPSPGLVPDPKRMLGWSPLSVLGPMARTVADAQLLLSVMAAGRDRDPISAICGSGAAVGFDAGGSVDLSRLRVAFSPDLGFTPTEQGVARTFMDKTGQFRGVFAQAWDAAPGCAGADESFEILRAVGSLAAHADKLRTRPDEVGPNVRADVKAGLRLSAEDVAHAQVLQTALHHRWQTFFGDCDLLLTPTITITPRPWTELYPSEIDGEPTRTYFHWLALAYAVTLAGHPAVSLPLGVDQHGMPFGLQIIGPRRGDAFVLKAAAALEALLAGDPRTARPTPDLQRLRDARPIAESAGFLDVS